MDSGYQFYGRVWQSDDLSGAVSCCHTRGPRPLEIVAAQMAGHIHYLANEIQVWSFQYCHGLGRQLAGVDATESDLRCFPNTSQKVVKNGRCIQSN